MALWSSLANFRFQATLRTWLYRTAFHAYIDDGRRQRRSKRENVPFESFDEIPDPCRALDLHRVLDEALGDLSGVERNAIAITSIAEYTQSEAAELMNIPLGTLKSHVARGKERLRQSLAQKGWEESK